MPPTGTTSTHLLLIRGNSGAGKSSLALAVREHLGRSCALIPQDLLRRTILKEPDIPGGHNIGLIDMTVRYALDHGYHVALEGILHAQRYRHMLDTLAADHRGNTHPFYLQVSFDESLRRHAGRDKAAEFGADQMRQWYCHDDLLGWTTEQIIPENSTLQDATKQVLTMLD